MTVQTVISPAVAFDAPAWVTAPAVPFDAVTVSVLFSAYSFGPDAGHWVTIDGEHVLIRGDRAVSPTRPDVAKALTRHPGYEGTPEGLVHPEATAVRFSLLDKAAGHEAKLAEHDRAIQEHSDAIRRLATQSDEYDGGSPEYRDLMEEMVKHETAQWEHIDAKNAALGGMHEELHPLLESPDQAAVTARSFTKVGAPQAEQATAAFNRLVSPDVASGTADFRQAKVRANYHPVNDRITLAKDSSVRVGVHELGHWLERHNSAVGEMANKFLRYRTQNEPRQSLRSLTGQAGYDEGEVARPDKFAHPYMGKEYPSVAVRDTLPGDDSYRYSTHTPTEIMSMGLERLTNAADAVAFAKADPEMFDFVVSTARGLNAK